MKLAVMQPYLFPYIGYFQLIKLVDRFVLYDDVAYIKRGWINRNRIKIADKGEMFTVPLSNCSQNILIRDIRLAVTNRWKQKFLRTIEYNYKKAPFFEVTMHIIQKILSIQTPFLRDWQIASFALINDYLKIGTHLIESSEKYQNRHLKGQHRILDICKNENASHYINPITGRELYSSDLFISNNVELSFIQPSEIIYNQLASPFIPRLSIIDVLMFNDVDKLCDLLGKYRLSKSEKDVK